MLTRKLIRIRKTNEVFISKFAKVFGMQQDACKWTRYFSQSNDSGNKNKPRIINLLSLKESSKDEPHKNEDPNGKKRKNYVKLINAKSLINEVSEKLEPESDKQRKTIVKALQGRLELINNRIVLKEYHGKEKNEDSRNVRRRGTKFNRSADTSKQFDSIKLPGRGKSSQNADEFMSASELMERILKKSSEEHQPINQTAIDEKQVSKYINILTNSESGLGMFEPPKKVKQAEEDIPTYKTAIDWWDEWQEQKDKEGEVVVKNHYQEMMDWMKEGKFPAFPVQNEEGMEQEQNIPFHKHVFLHEYLEEGFPKHGPVRKFMEAVILGLSNNPYLTVEEKQDHIYWFRDYFNEKYETLKTLGAVSNTFEQIS